MNLRVPGVSVTVTIRILKFIQDTNVCKAVVSVWSYYYQNINVCKEAIIVGFEGPTAVVTKSSIFWDIMPLVY
jgi:hypothetical protein